MDDTTTLGDTLIRAIVAPTPDQLAEHHEMAQSLEWDRELHHPTIQERVA